MATASRAQSDPADNSLTLDVYAFSQDDDGGDPFRTEGFDYYSFRGGLKLEIDDEYTLRLIASPAYLANEDPMTLPATIVNGSVTSASGDLLTLDALAKLDYRPRGSTRTYSPGLYYHHQIDYIGAGLDFDIAEELYGGDAVVKLSYSLRYDFLELNYWDRSHRGSDERVTNNLQLAWTQNLSPSWKASTGVQYSRQDGFLSDQNNYVTLFDATGTPVLLADEVLPNHRNRVQWNGRLRYSPSLGHSLGLDVSAYRDDWDLDHQAVEPSVDLDLGADVRLRSWWRVTWQNGTRYERERSTAPSRYQTQDSDLMSFTMHSPGLTLRIPLGTTDSGRSWETAVSAYGFSRADGVTGIGGKIQLVIQW